MNKSSRNVEFMLLVEDISEPIDEGIKKYSFKFAEYIRRNNSASQIFTCYKNTNVVNIKKLPTNKLLFSFRFIGELFKARKKTIIYIPNASSTFMSFIRIRLISIWTLGAETIIISLQKRKHNRFQKLAIRYLLRPSKIIVFSEREKDYYRSLTIEVVKTSVGVNVDKYNSISYEKKNELRKKLAFSINDKIVLHVGHINRGRNISVFKDFAKLGFLPVIVGSTCYDDDLKLKQELINSGVVLYDTYLENINEYYQISDIYVFPVNSDDSVIEFPLSILEAMSCNIPVISTDYGSIKDYFIETDSFTFFHSKKQLLENIKMLRNTNIVSNRRIILEYFTWDNVFTTLINNI
jgi:glycosyltransferase involved in cell wall biosynthesis